DRRPTGRRTTRMELHEPDAGAIESLLALNPHAGIKLAPAAQLPPRWMERAELEWINRGGECRQLVAWFGELAQRSGFRRATVLGKSAAERRTFVGRPNVEAPVAEQFGRYL